MLRARPGGQLRAADRRVGVRRRGVVHADLVLVPARRRRPPRASRRSSSTCVGDVGLVLGTFFIFKHTGTLDFLGTFARGARRLRRAATPTSIAGCLLLLVGAFAKSRADPAAHVAARRDGGPDPGQRADPRRDDGDRRRLPDRAHAPAVRARAGGGRRRRDRRRATLLIAGTIGTRRRPTSSASSPTRRCPRSAT